LTIRFQARGAIFAIVIFKPDLILIYRKPDAASLELVRIGSHSPSRLKGGCGQDWPPSKNRRGVRRH
jgi:hypothetical protein